MIPCALLRGSDADGEVLQEPEQSAAVAAVGHLAAEVEGAAAGDEVQGVFNQSQGIVREACEPQSVSDCQAGDELECVKAGSS